MNMLKLKISAGSDTHLLTIQNNKGVQAQMARTKTQKALLQAERSGTWCAERNRRKNDQYGTISQHVRVTPSKREKLNKVKHKERIFQDGAPFACLEKAQKNYFTVKKPFLSAGYTYDIVWATSRSVPGTNGGSKYNWQSRMSRRHAPAA